MPTEQIQMIRQTEEENGLQIIIDEENVASELKELCNRGTENKIRDLLCHIDPNIEFQKSRPVHWVAVSGNVHALNALLQDPRTIVTHIKKDNKRTALHLAAIKGNHEVLKRLLDTNKIDVNAVDKQGRTAFHLAAEMSDEGSGTEERFLRCLSLLMNRPELEVNKPDTYGRSALSRALRKCHKARVLAILQHEGEHDLNLDYSLVDGGKTVRESIMEKFPEFETLMVNSLMEDINALEPSVRLLATLQRGLLVDFTNLLKSNKDLSNSKYGKPYYCTCLEITCIIDGREKFVEALLDHGADANINNYISGIPLLYITAERLNIPALEILLNSKAIDITTRGINNGTVLHWLALNKRTGNEVCSRLDKCVSLLLLSKSDTIDIDAKDSRGETALHVAVRWDNLNLALTLLALGASTETWSEKKHTPLHVAALNGNKNAVLTLIRYGANIHAQKDDRGTPLYAAAQQRKNDIVFLLLKQGASFICERQGEQSLQYIDARTLELFFDDCITSNLKNPKDQNYTVKFKYNLLPSLKEDFEECRSQIEIDALLKMSEIPEHRSLLKHPLISTVLFLKWRHACKAFYFNIALYSLFVIFLTLYIVYSSIVSKENEPGVNPLMVLLCVFLFFIIVREIVEFINIKKEYFRNVGNILDAVIIISTIVVCCSKPNDDEPQHAAAIAILFSWLEFLFLIGRLPSISVQLEMLKKVSYTFFKFGLCYLPLIVAFSLSFKILFRGQHRKYEPYNTDGAWNTTSNGFLFIFETFVMFTGEFAAKDLPFINTPVTSHLIFFLFMFLVALALLNLLNGLAVSDTQTIIDDAETLSLTARAKLVLHMENIVQHYQKYRFLNQFVGKFAFSFTNLPNNILYVYPNKNCKVTFIPNGDKKANLDENITKKAVVIANRDEAKIEGDSIRTVNVEEDDDTKFEHGLESFREYKNELNNVSLSIKRQIDGVKEDLSKINDKYVQFKNNTDRSEQTQKEILDIVLSLKKGKLG